MAGIINSNFTLGKQPSVDEFAKLDTMFQGGLAGTKQATDLARSWGASDNEIANYVSSKDFGVADWGKDTAETRNKYAHDFLNSYVSPKATPSAPLVTEAGARALSPKNWDINADQRVEDRVGGIIERNSPLMQQAETRAKQQMNERGLMNSSIGVQAGQAAVMDAAESIASKDASTYANAAKFNADTQNQFTQAQLEREQKMALAEMDRDTRFKLGEMEIQSKNSTSGSQLYTQTIKNISDIQRDDTLDAANKQAAIEDQVAMLKSGLNVFGGGISSLNLDGLLNFKPSNVAVESAQATAASNAAQAENDRLQGIINQMLQNQNTQPASGYGDGGGGV